MADRLVVVREVQRVLVTRKALQKVVIRTGQRGETGQQGPQGETGPQGPQGSIGPQGLPGNTQLFVAKQGETVSNNSNVTPTDVTGLAFALTAGHRYYVRFFLRGMSAATTTGLGFTFSGPTMTVCSWRIQNQQGVAGTDQFYTNSTNNLTTVLVNVSVVAISTYYVMVVEGIFEPNENGTLQLRIRSEVNASQISVDSGIGLLVDCG